MSSICPSEGRTSISGSTRPVGLITCSATRLDLESSSSRGVAETQTTSSSMPRNSSYLRGRLSRALGQAEAVVDQGGLAAAVARVHRAHLRQGDVGLVDEGDELLGEVVDEDAGPAPGSRPARGAE